MSIEKQFFFAEENRSDQLREDILLWESLKKGNELAFSSLYKKYVQCLFNYGMHIHSDKDLVKDCLQELFAQIWDKRDSLSSVEKVRFYLFRSFKNLLCRKLEAFSKRNSFSQEYIEHLAPEPSLEYSWIHFEQDEERLIRLKTAVSMLTPRQRELVLLKFFHGLEVKEISKIMNLTIAGVHNLVSLTIKSLREKVKWNEYVVLYFVFEFYMTR